MRTRSVTLGSNDEKTVGHLLVKFGQNREIVVIFMMMLL